MSETPTAGQRIVGDWLHMNGWAGVESQVSLERDIDAIAARHEALLALLRRVVKWDEAQELEAMEADPFTDIVRDIRRELGDAT